MPARTMNVCLGLLVFCSVVAGRYLFAADPPSAQLALSFEPVQKGVEYETPAQADFDKCRVKVERSGKNSGWMVIGPAGQILRRFIDTNGDNVVDQWRYYYHGLEVYRDVDSNFNNKVDQSRWLNTGGSKWGIDKDEDRVIDSWKVISAQEAGREAFRALMNRDERALSILTINADDIRRLGLIKPLGDKLLESVKSPGSKMREILSGSKIITNQSRWMRFDSATPSTIPADAGKATSDLTVYDNAMGIIEINGKSELLQLGEMIRVGETWKLTQIPRPLEGKAVQITVGGLLMQPSMASISPEGMPAGKLSPETENLLKQLQELDAKAPTPTSSRVELARYNARRANLLNGLVAAASTEEERVQWIQQMVDGIAAAVQTGTYEEGLTRLNSIEADIQKNKPNSKLRPYIAYRRMLAEYSVKMTKAGTNAEQQEVQKWWPQQLENFITKYPTGADAPDATMQLAIAREFEGKTKQARKWYQKVADNYRNSTAVGRASGAVRRLDLQGKQFTFTGTGLQGRTITADSFRGKVLLVVFWATWSKGHTEDLPQLRALYKKYRAEGFEILGVNLDTNRDSIRGYLLDKKITWPQVHEPGGMESRPAVAFGIIAPSTMFLIDKAGKVVSRGTSVEEAKAELPGLLKR